VAALELAALVLPEADRAASYRTEFIELLGIDPVKVGNGHGRRAARILSAVLSALRERDGRSNAGADHRVDGHRRNEPDDELGTDDGRDPDDGLE
jgi:hypothetical protein